MNPVSCSHNHLWIVNHHAALPSKDGGAARHLKLSTHLPDYGWTSTLIVGSTRHSDGSQRLGGLRLRKVVLESGVNTLWVRTNSYGHNLYLRFLGMVLFAVNLLRPRMTRGLQAPDIVLGSTVHPLAAWAGYRLACRVKVPFVYEIRDVWPESLYDLAGISKRHPVAKVLAKIDSMLVDRADLVVSPLPHVDRHLSEMGFSEKPFLWVANGADLPDDADYPKPQSGLPFTFMYLGAHGRANALENILDAFDTACVREPDLDLRLRFVGDGPLKNTLMTHASGLRSSNRISFEDAIPKSQVLSRAREADCLVSNLLDKPVYRFGVSLNKYFLYMSAGRPAITASSAPNNPIREAGSGIEVAGGDVNGISDAMIHVARLPLGDRVELARNGRSELERNYTFDVLARKLATSLNKVLTVNGE